MSVWKLALFSVSWAWQYSQDDCRWPNVKADSVQTVWHSTRRTAFIGRRDCAPPIVTRDTVSHFDSWLIGYSFLFIQQTVICSILWFIIPKNHCDEKAHESNVTCFTNHRAHANCVTQHGHIHPSYHPKCLGWWTLYAAALPLVYIKRILRVPTCINVGSINCLGKPAKPVCVSPLFFSFLFFLYSVPSAAFSVKVSQWNW